jgi:predicted phosphohydrolase
MIVLNREVGRLERSLSSAKKEAIVFLHYPPVYGNVYCSEIMDILKKYGVKRCYYGHLHGKAFDNARTGIVDGIDFSLVSSDYLKFKPLKIN